MCFNKCKCIGFLIEVFNVGRRKFSGKQLILLTNNKFRQVSELVFNESESWAELYSIWQLTSVTKLVAPEDFLLKVDSSYRIVVHGISSVLSGILPTTKKSMVLFVVLYVSMSFMQKWSIEKKNQNVK